MSNANPLRPAYLFCLLVGLLIIIAAGATLAQRGRLFPLVQLVAIATMGVYTILVATRIRRSDVEAVVPSRVLEALDSLSEGLMILDEQQKILLANQAFCTSVGLNAGQLVGSRAESLAWDSDATSEAGDFPWQQAIESGKRQTERLLRYRHPDGTVRILSINCSPIIRDGSKTRGALATFRDVTQIEAHRAELSSRIRHLEVLAAHDPLTECLNRRALVPKMQAVWEESLQDSLPMACLMIDNDHFKLVNDSYGHEMGDVVLRRVAEAIRQSVPEASLVCRYGGEEFCVVLPSTDIELAMELAERTRQQIAAIEFDGLKELRTAVSIGVSATGLGADNPQELITQADQCLYLAKHQGRNRVVVMSASIGQMLQPDQPDQDYN